VTISDTEMLWVTMEDTAAGTRPMRIRDNNSTSVLSVCQQHF